MKSYQVELSPRALRDLDRAKREVFAASQSNDVAANYVGRILSEIELLETFPARFPFWRAGQSYRFLIVQKYVAFFRLIESRVEIAHVRSAGRKPFLG